MLHQIRTRPDLPHSSNEPVELLLACHARLRHFSELALALASRSDLEHAQVVDASHRLVRYFRVALPLHEADEEQTLTPALVELATREQIDALGQMRDQHGLLHDVLAELFPLWELAETEPGKLVGNVALPHALRLMAVLDVHLQLEETIIFPLIASIEPAQRKRLLDEMRGRRSAEVVTEMRRIAP